MTLLPPKEVAEKLRVSTDLVRKWCIRELINHTTYAVGVRKRYQIPLEECERLQQMLYPYGLPANWGAPVNPTELSRQLLGVRISWAPHMAKWGLLKAGKTPEGGLVIKDIHEVANAREKLAIAPGVVDICCAHTADDADIVACVELLLRKSNVIPPATPS